MGTNNQTYKEWKVDLAINILNAEKVINEITALELKKHAAVGGYNSFDSFIPLLMKYSCPVSEKQQIDFQEIYGIIYRESIFCDEYRVVKSLTFSKIRSMIGKWNPPAAGQMKIGEVLKDIYNRVSNCIQGVVYYYTGKSVDKRTKGRFGYKLIIKNNIAIFVDLNRKIIYRILTEHRR